MLGKHGSWPKAWHTPTMVRVRGLCHRSKVTAGRGREKDMYILITSSVNGQLVEELPHIYIIGQGQRSKSSMAPTRPILFTMIIHSVFCLMIGPKPPPKWWLHIVRSIASSLKWEYPLLSLSSSSRFLRLLPRLLATSVSPFIFPSITCFRRQFLRKMWQIQLAFRFIISWTICLGKYPLHKELEGSTAWTYISDTSTDFNH